jgi:uncharacterized membrane protein (UPF0127 family)
MSRDEKMTITFTVAALVLIAAIAGIWLYIFFGIANPPLPRAQVSVGASSANADSSSSSPGADQLAIDGATFNVEIASTTVEQTRGLSYRASLGKNDGMLFLFDSGTVRTFWMKDMHFPLDMIWISGNTVAGFAQNVPAPTSSVALWSLPIYSSPDNVDKVLEVNAGTVAQYNIKIGDAVNIGAIDQP